MSSASMLRMSAMIPLLITSCGKRDGGTVDRDRGEGSAAPPRDLEAREVWRADVEGASVMPISMVRVEGGALVAWDVEGEAVFPGRPPFRSAGDRDVVVTRVSGSGAIESLHPIGTAGDEAVTALLSGEPAALILRGTAAMTLAGTRLAPPPAADEYSTPRWGALVSLDESGAPTAAIALDGAAAGWRAVRAPGGWIIASSHDRDDAKRAVVQRIRGGDVVWSRELPGVAVSQVVEVDGAIAALTRGKALGIVRLDADSGKVIASEDIERLGGNGSGDLGELVGAVRAGPSTVVYGYSGREAVQVEGETLSHSIEPLTVVLEASRPPRRAQLLDVTGRVETVGTIAGVPAALVVVIHNGALYGGLDVEHRGTYLVLGGHDGVPSLVPLVQYRYAGDDWENKPAEMVTGTERMSTMAALIENERVWRAGQCRSETRACIAQHQIVAAPGRTPGPAR